MPFFLANTFLFFGLAALVPIALHLLQRKKPRPVKFAAMRFLRAAIEQTRRSRRITQCATLIMRVLIILTLAVAFAQPLVRFGEFLPAGRRVVIVVIDSSASMRALEGGLTRFEIARSWALEMLQDLKDDDLVALLAPGTPEPQVVFPPVSARAEVIQALNELSCGWGRAEMLSVVSDCLKREEGSLTGMELHLFSDFQRSDFVSSDLPALMAELRRQRGILFCNLLSRDRLPNCGFEEAQFMPPAIVGDGSFTVRATIRASENFTGGNLLRLQQAGNEREQSVLELQPGQSSKAVLRDSPLQAEGDVSGYLELEPDAFPADNRFYFSLPRLAGIPALLVNGGGGGNRDIFFLDKAIRPGGLASTIVMPSKTDWQHFLARDIAEFSFLFLCNPPEFSPAVQEKINAFVQTGGVAAIFPGENNAITREALQGISGWEKISLETETMTEEKSFNLALNDLQDLMARTVRDKLSPPWRFPLRKRLKLSLPAGQSVPWMYEDGSPFAVSARNGGGMLWLFSVSANRDWSDWPITPFFFVFMQELIKNSASSRSSSLITEVGKPLLLSWPGRETEAQFTLHDSTGRSDTLSARRKDSASPFLLDGFYAPGLYELSRGDISRSIAVNISPSEGLLSACNASELRAAAPGALLQVSEDPAELRRHLSEQHQGRPLWPSLLLLAFLLSMLEVLFANIRSRQRSQPQQITALLSGLH
jgi:hypothetical protein